MTALLNREQLDALLGHTPGPWTAFPKPKYQEWHVSIPVPDSPTSWAFGLFPDGVPGDNAGADARLIAAAPDLLITSRALLTRAETAEARLAQVLEVLDEEDRLAGALAQGDTMRQRHKAAGRYHVIKALRAALAQAGGEEHG